MCLGPGTYVLAFKSDVVLSLVIIHDEVPIFFPSRNDPSLTAMQVPFKIEFTISRIEPFEYRLYWHHGVRVSVASAVDVVLKSQTSSATKQVSRGVIVVGTRLCGLVSYTVPSSFLYFASLVFLPQLLYGIH